MRPVTNRMLRALCALALALSLAALTAGPASSGARRSVPDRVRVRAGRTDPPKVGLVPGVTYTSKTISGPNRVHIVTIDPSSDATIDVSMAVNSLPGYVRTSTMAAEHNAVAAVNGDFGLPPGRPGHAIAEDGNLMQTSPLGADGKNFAIKANEEKAFIESSHIKIDVRNVTTQEHFLVERWNDGTAHANEIGGFTNYGGNVAQPPGGACAARMLPDGAPKWADDQSVERAYQVGAVDCGASRMPLGEGIVIATPSDGARADDIKSLTTGDEVELSWSVGFPGILDTVGGSPLLIEHGKIQVKPCSSYLCEHHPRTAVGIKANGDIMLFQVDGRSKVSRGLTLVGLAREMHKRGCDWAMNLDGGGSSTMWVKGKGIVNDPSDGPERGVTNALLVLPHGDDGDPSGMLKGPVFTGAVVGSPQGQADIAAYQADLAAAVTDPGSTGGLLDAMANGDLGGARRVPDDVAPFLRAFRAARPSP